MKPMKSLFVLLVVFCLASICYGAPEKKVVKKKILVVSSYDRGYTWSQDTNKGFCDAMLKFGYFDNKEQAEEFTKNDIVETSKVIVKKLWMDAKRKNSKAELAQSTAGITAAAREFKPDLLFLGDDDAANYIGSGFLDSATPMVFWGVNNTPMKYGLVDSMDKPGHNATGVYESGFYAESLQLLKTLVPKAKTFATLSDATSTGRSHYKAIEYAARQGTLPLQYVEGIYTNNYEEWKQKALELQGKVDAFFIAQYAGLEDKEGKSVSLEEAGKWYLTNIKIPEATRGHFVRHGMLCSADDSGYNQAFEAVVIANDIMAKGRKPEIYPPRFPRRGALMVNRQRAEMLGIKLTDKMGIEEYFDKATALSAAP